MNLDLENTFTQERCTWAWIICDGPTFRKNYRLRLRRRLLLPTPSKFIEGSWGSGRKNGETMRQRQPKSIKHITVRRRRTVICLILLKKYLSPWVVGVNFRVKSRGKCFFIMARDFSKMDVKQSFHLIFSLPAVWKWKTWSGPSPKLGLRNIRLTIVSPIL